eukprot:sb/3473409/
MKIIKRIFTYDLHHPAKLDKFVVGSRGFLFEHFAFLPLKIDPPITEIRLNNPCVLLTHSLNVHYGSLHCPASLHGHILSGKNAKCSKRKPLLPTTNLSNSDSVHSHFKFLTSSSQNLRQIGGVIPGTHWSTLEVESLLDQLVPLFTVILLA